MPKINLTDRFVATAKAKAKTDYFDSKTTGLGLRVSPSGVKAWSVMFELAQGRQASTPEPRPLSRNVSC